VNPLEFQISEEEDFEKTETVNISEGGLMFMSKNDVPSGTVIRIHMPVYDKVFKIKAKVVHTQKDETSELFRIGVAFETYAEAFKVKLIEQIYLIEEYRVLRSLQESRDISLREASEEWIKRYSERFKKLYW
jgi:c-di-GMP-binding flagellar brake protein YcgR